MFGWLRAPRSNPARLRAVVVLALLGLGLATYFLSASLLRASRRHTVQQALDVRDYADANTRLAHLLRSAPDDREWLLLAARAARLAGDFPLANRHLDRLYDLGGDRRAGTLERALLTCQAGDLTSVENLLLAHLAEQPADSEIILETLTEAYLKARRLPEARECLKRWLQRQPDNVQALLWQGQAREWWGDLDEAINSYRQAARIDPANPRARRLLALALIRSDRAPEGVELLEALGHDDGDVELQLALARGRRCLGQTAEAQRLLEKVLAREPNNADALTEQGKLALQNGKPDLAESPLRRAIAASPFDREANYTYYLCLRQLAHDEEADKVLQKVEQIRTDLQRVSELRRQVIVRPRDPSLRCEVGLIFLRNGQPSEGLRWLHSALQLDPNNVQAKHALALAQKQLPKEERR